MRLYEALELLRSFFSAHGRGLDDSSLAGMEYITLERQLRVSHYKTSLKIHDLLAPEGCMIWLQDILRYNPFLWGFEYVVICGNRY